MVCGFMLKERIVWLESNQFIFIWKTAIKYFCERMCLQLLLAFCNIVSSVHHRYCNCCMKDLHKIEENGFYGMLWKQCAFTVCI